MEIMPLLHFCWTLYITLYGFITNKNWFDFYYLFYIYVVCFSWTFYNGDCPITYYYNKQTNPFYQAGSFREESDLHIIFGEKNKEIFKKYHTIIVSLLSIICSFSMYRVMKRQKFPLLSIFILFFIYGSYYVTIMNNMDYHVLFCPLLLGCLLYILSVWK